MFVLIYVIIKSRLVFPYSAVKDSKVTKSVERILTIWEERSMYSEELIRQLKSGLVRPEEPAKGQNYTKHVKI